MVKHEYKGRTLQNIKTAEENLPPQGFKSVLVHTGTNNILVMADGPRTLAKYLEELGYSLEKREENCKVIISSIIAREDADYDAKMIAANAELRKVCWKNKWVYVDNENIDSSSLNISGLHLNTKGHSMLARNLIGALRKQSTHSFPNGNDKGNFQRKHQSDMWEFLNLLGKLSWVSGQPLPLLINLSPHKSLTSKSQLGGVDLTYLLRYSRLFARLL